MFFGPLLQSAVANAAPPVTGTIAFTLDSFSLVATAVDPDSSSFPLVPGSYVLSATARVASSASIALVPGSYVLSASVVDPDASSFPLVLGAYTVSGAANSTVSTSAALVLGSYVLDAELVQAGSNSIALVLDPYTMAVQANSTVSGALGLQLGSFVLDAESAVSNDPRVGIINLVLEAFTMSATITVSGEGQQFPTISEIIPGVLNDLVARRVWQEATPDNLPRGSGDQFLPFIVWNIVGGQDSEYVDQTISNYSNARVQIHCLASGSIMVDLLSRRARDALLASPYTVGVLGSSAGTYDADRKLRGRRQQFSIWFRQT